MKVILWMAISLNGIIATKDFKEDFLSHKNWIEFVSAVSKSKCLIWGRKTYEQVIEWPRSYLDSLDGFTKIIISNQNNIKLKGGFVLASSPEEALSIAREYNHKNVILTGGSKNNSSFAEKELINEIVLNIEGHVIGSGIPLFNESNFEMKLNLQSVKKISDNIIQVHYKVIK